MNHGHFHLMFQRHLLLNMFKIALTIFPQALVSVPCLKEQDFLTTVQVSNLILVLDSFFSNTTQLQSIASLHFYHNTPAHAAIIFPSSGVYPRSLSAPFIILHAAIWMISKMKVIMLFPTTHPQHLTQVPFADGQQGNRVLCELAAVILYSLILNYAPLTFCTPGTLGSFPFLKHVNAYCLRAFAHLFQPGMLLFTRQFLLTPRISVFLSLIMPAKSSIHGLKVLDICLS